MQGPAFLKVLQQELPQCLRTDKARIEAAARDRSAVIGQCAAVVEPHCEADVVKLMHLAEVHNFAVVPRGAGTSATGAALPFHGSVVLDLSTMNKILTIDVQDMVAEVEPGVITETLQRAVEATGLFYPPDPASSDISTIGGNVATCAGGLRAVKYGVTRDYVLGLRAVLVGGDVLDTGGRNLKDVSGYDLTRLLVGSEGTLAVITRITLRLIPLPPARRTWLASFRDDAAAFAAADAVLASGIWPRALESMDGQALRLAAGSSFIPPEIQSQLLIELDGEEIAVKEEESRLLRVLNEHAAVLRDANDSSTHAQLWAGRRGISAAVLTISPAKQSEDFGVPRGQLARFVATLKRLGSEHGIGVLVYGHAGDANLHCNFLYDPAVEGAVTRLKACISAGGAAALALHGTLTGEHGVGLRKRDAVAEALGPVRCRLMHSIKRAFDPQKLLNPGKVLPTDPS